MTHQFTQEQLDAAKQELDTFTPQDLLDLRKELELTKIPEAPAIVFTDQGLKGPSGMIVKLTARACNLIDALDMLAEGVHYAREKYSMQPVGTPTTAQTLPMSLAPTPPPPGEPGIFSSVPASDAQLATSSQVITQSPTTTQEIPVVSISRERKRDGKGDFLRVKGGHLYKFGCPAYPEVFPQTLNVDKMQYSIEYTQIPADMKFATVTGDKPFRVLKFHG